MSGDEGAGAELASEDRGTLLVVDDEPDVRTVAGLMVRKGGYEVVEAANGREAVEALAARTETIVAVLLDVTMPEMNGHEALPKLRELVPGLPVVLISGYDRGEVAQHLSDPSAPTEFVPKPFTRQQLLAAIARVVAARP